MTQGAPGADPRPPAGARGDRGRQFRAASTWLNASVVGIQFPVAIAIGYFFGRFLDRHLGTWPWLTIVFSVFGIAAGFVNLFRITAQASRSEEDQLRPELGLKVYPPDDQETEDEVEDGDATRARDDGG
ncbi:MAG TPA: AtpZ/AtpI family protein [Thermoanaerobaculales bacterium]|nr:AtpZ/AtpI family protein [Thermoanaerobaculales bacterium]HPA82759.1 AtpZ/AtpI family protein [Thermoanaerobaculales bacterium]HQL30560.1 AtpZ/AtpI family protein [Thermoanaerobaculales bacterium]HQP43593.1 AtpZ/AtpI family protein [Thermoanaerobaculales bacterium]